MNKINYLLLALLFCGGWACEKDSDFLTRSPAQTLTTEQALGDAAQVESILSNLYSRQFSIVRLNDWGTFADFNEVYVAANDGATNNWHNNNSWGWNGTNGYWGTWDYGYIREMNLFIQRMPQATIPENLIRTYTAEARYLRAAYYYELAKLFGGVPIILEPLTYDFSGDPTYLQVPRSTEAEIYDFVIQEATELATLLPVNSSGKSRATAGAALAMKAQAAVYAGSLARYGATTPSVTLGDGVIGIPESRAEGYYTTALEAAQRIIDGEVGDYSLYLKDPNNLSENFAALFYDKNANPEVIYQEEYLLKFKTHGYTVSNQPRFGAEEEEGGAMNPSLNLAQSFELLDNTFAPFPTVDDAGNPIYYDEQEDIFANRDARLGGTIILPGSTFKGRPVDIWAGVRLADGEIVTGNERGQLRELPGSNVPQQVVGFDGPLEGTVQNAVTGFYVRKYLDPTPGSGQRGNQSDVSRIQYRFGEILLIAAEAAFELGDPATAADYMNRVRERAGFTIPLTPDEITFDRIVHERRVEFALEGQYYMDLKRFRIAHEVFDGAAMDLEGLKSNLGSATKRSTQPWGLWPYKVYDPGSPNDGKWYYTEVLPSRVTAADTWQLGNYYSNINNDILANNPALLRQPLQ
ncbi:RagB/SusD family nutrient uptake outer membrane protein [Lewinella sp. IMCC34183]|uniref:RagB/SusD family nutrient uptake outer membrane protein n=1 Tax=Lewinella sp. IMCC34183 TaxID=2248762 RepID=UPI000E256BC6|nr:RagB/SusD family nutrient uptake outer membrane protein [Lewinella sp. IMCC34183]